MFYIQSLVDRIIKKPEKNILGMSKYIYIYIYRFYQDMDIFPNTSG